MYKLRLQGSGFRAGQVMAQFRSVSDECWGQLSHTGWDGVRHYIIATCDKKPRDGCLTCWWHRKQEGEARRLREKLKESDNDTGN